MPPTHRRTTGPGDEPGGAHDGDPGGDAPNDAPDEVARDAPHDFPYYEDHSYADGNALAGPLSEVFAVDLTAARARCVFCGSHGPLARLRVYARGPGVTARCPECANVVLRLVRAPGRAWLDMRGTISLVVPLAD